MRSGAKRVLVNMANEQYTRWCRQISTCGLLAGFSTACAGIRMALPLKKPALNRLESNRRLSGKLLRR
jgi:hypothetical protein